MVSSYAQATTSKTSQIKDSQIKVYVKKDMVRVSEEGFAIVTKGGMFRTKALRSDATGFYVTFKDICCEKRRPRLWRCRKCGKVVEGESEVKEHIAEKGREHRFFYPIDTPED